MAQEGTSLLQLELTVPRGVPSGCKAHSPVKEQDEALLQS